MWWVAAVYYCGSCVCSLNEEQTSADSSEITVVQSQLFLLYKQHQGSG